MERVVEAPPSKSYTHRALICAALAEGESTLIRPLDSDDTRATAEGLIALGADIEFGDGVWKVRGTGGKLTPRSTLIDCRESGTTMRLLTAVAALSPKPIVLTGAPRLCERPIGELLKALQQLGANARSLNEHNPDCPPVEVYGGLRGGEVTVRGDISSQFISGLLLAAPLAQDHTGICVEGELISAPYSMVTLDVMKAFGVNGYALLWLDAARKFSSQLDDELTILLGIPQGAMSKAVENVDVTMVEKLDGVWRCTHPQLGGYDLDFSVNASQQYERMHYEVEGDYSQAAYFALAAALTQQNVTIKALNPRTAQGDLSFFHLMHQIGCKVEWTKGRKLSCASENLRGCGEINLSHYPDIVPPLAVAAAFAEGETVITGIHHLESKESPRVTVLWKALQAMGIEAERIVFEKSGKAIGLRVVGCRDRSRPVPALIKTHHDHRIAMSFGCAKLVVPELELDDYACVKKSYPGFWRDLNKATGGKHKWLRELAEKYS